MIEILTTLPLRGVGQELCRTDPTQEAVLDYGKLVWLYSNPYGGCPRIWQVGQGCTKTYTNTWYMFACMEFTMGALETHALHLYGV